MEIRLNTNFNFNKIAYETKEIIMITVTVCGSGKNKDVIHGICEGLSNKGFIVLSPPLHDIDGLTKNTDEECKLLTWKGATFAHFNRIETADICLIVNPEGYSGNSTTLELGYAVANRKLIVAMKHDIKEYAREGLFDIILETEDIESTVQKFCDVILN